MSWNRLSPWFAHRSPTYDEPPPLTLVTLAIIHNDPSANAFYASAEFDMLVEWARTGQFILAFTTNDRAELTLVCADPVDIVTARIKQLPLVEAGIACADIRAVKTLRLAGSSQIPPH